MFIAAFVFRSQDMEIELTINGWMNKEFVVYISNGILFSHKKIEEILPFVTTCLSFKILCEVK